MLTWTDAADSTPGHIPGVRFVDSTGRWTAARVGEDPRLGWCVWERREKRMVRLVPSVHIGSEAEAKAVAQVLRGDLGETHGVANEVRREVAAILVVRAMRGLLSSAEFEFEAGMRATAEAARPPKGRVMKTARSFDEGERGTYQGLRFVRADSVTRTSNPPRYAFDEVDKVDGVAKTHYLDGSALLEVE